MESGKKRFRDSEEESSPSPLPASSSPPITTSIATVVSVDDNSISSKRSKECHHPLPATQPSQLQSLVPSSSSSTSQSHNPPPPLLPLTTNKEIIKAKDFLFQGIDKNLRNQLQVDDIALFSVTDSQQADQMTNKILSVYSQHYPSTPSAPAPPPSTDSPTSPPTSSRNNLTIFDGMACVGGNTISFAKYFSHVLSNELNSHRYEMLQHNILQVLNYKNVAVYNSSILDLAFTLIYDILFLDPEWGGPDYKFKKNICLTISSQPLEEFCVNIFQRCPHVKLIALKLPVNYHNIYLRNMMKSHNITHIFDNTFHKMSLHLLIPLGRTSSSSSSPSSQLPSPTEFSRTSPTSIHSTNASSSTHHGEEKSNS